ncbi:SlyX family protein [Marinobacterium sediminicola]|uniref:SlyX protein n=1 Tax=Marinobacterium sediminicola TaxID=518898 RepID=A0ABY1S0B1_9GAMM|nr:SlyX family protein [Marinobacterium sediminicola]ULG69979.1 SlyX family protein [Marinobacterium sediminicola]SMR74430.1 SlyX protein [Marinobacterium sediminicola]
MTDHETLAELESRIAFQEDAIDKLSEMVAKQEMDIERLTRMVKILNVQLREMGTGENVGDANEVPPHY